MNINLVYISDTNYIINTCVSIYSVYKNKCKEHNYIVNLIVDDEDVDWKDKLLSLNCSNFCIKIIKFVEDVDCFQIDGFLVTPIACAKFYIPELLENVDKVLYLDGDTIVNSDLSEFFDTDIISYYAAVVNDPIMEIDFSEHVSLISDGGVYFNSGVMLLNLVKMRDDKVCEKLISYRKNGINKFMDQDALNAVIGGNVILSSLKYNYLVTLNNRCDIMEIMKRYNWDEDNYLEFERLNKAEIVHLTGSCKPWKEYIPYITAIFMRYYVDSPVCRLGELNPKLGKKIKSQIKNIEFIFPFGKIKQGSTIYLWGAGTVGREYLRQIQKTNYCTIKAIIDNNADTYNSKSVCVNGVEIVTPKSIAIYEKKTVVVAVKDKYKAKQIIDYAKILWGEMVEIVWDI